MCTRLHFDHAMYVTVPVWFDAQIAGDVSSVGVPALVRLCARN
jgi:hypothetical protein